MPLASLDISVVTFNSERWIETFLRSLLTQSVDCKKINLFVQDNGSTDRTVSILNDLSSQFREKFAAFQVNAGKNVGFGRGHNKNLRRASCKYFLVSNVDLEFEHDTLEILLATAEKDDADVAAWECRQKPYEHPKLYDAVTLETHWCSSACLLFRASAIKSINGYEPRLFMYGEDVEISYRLRDKGFRLRYLPRAIVWHYTYEGPAETKPLQFLGSTLANVLLRCRYGKWREVATGFLMYIGLFFLPPRFQGQRSGLFRNFGRLFTLAPRFLLSRRTSEISFSFRLWDYEIARDGAFYKYRKQQKTPRLPLVSILVRTMPGRSGKLREAVASVVNQTYPNVELVIVEDGGSSASDLVKELRAQAVVSKIKHVPLRKSGRCVAGNAALEASEGELLCFLDDDDLLFADHLEVLVAEWLEQPDLGGVYGLAYQVRTEVISDEPWVYKDTDYSVMYRQVFKRAILWHHNYLPIQTVLFRRDLYVNYGGFDLRLENLEDWNLWVRYSLKHDFLMVPKTTSLYRVPAKSQTAAERQSVLDVYYEKAQQRHAELRVELSPVDILNISKDLAHEVFYSNISSRRLRDFILGNPVFRRFYHPLRKMAHYWRSLRSR